MPPARGGSRGRHALVIGIDDYPLLPRRSRLEGSVNDARAVSRLLVDELDFAPGDVEVLPERDATRDGILGALERLAERCAPDDAIFFHFSGHGSRRRVLEPGGGTGFEPVLVPRDSARAEAGQNRDVSGPELRSWLDLLGRKTQRIVVVLDCCHSGHLVRSGTRERVRVRTTVADPRVCPALGTPWTTGPAPCATPGPSGWLPTATTYTLIAACRHDEQAHEVEASEGGTKGMYGALTRALLDGMARATPDTTYRELHPCLVAGVRGQGRRQHPQIEGSVNRLLLRLKERPPRNEAMVVARQQHRLVLDAGSLHGAGRGSEWTLHEPAPTASPGPAVGRARVSLVTATRSDAEIVTETAAPRVRAGFRAIEVAEGSPSSALVVRLEVGDEHREWGARLAGGLEASLRLRRTTEERLADVTAAVLGPRDGLAPGLRAPELGCLTAPTCALLGSSGQVLAPPLAIDHPLALESTLANLRSLARRRRLRSLARPCPAGWEGGIALRLLRRDDDGQWVRADGTESGGELDCATPAFDDGESFSVELVNVSSFPVYPHLLDLGIGGSIDLLLPESGVSELLEPGRALAAGIRHELTFRVPDSVPFARPGAPGTAGRETLIAVVTREPTDLGRLRQPAFRDASWAGSALSGKEPVREVMRGPSPRSSAWAVEVVELRLSRPRRRPQGRRAHPA